jgi:RecG-like helicase
LEKYSLPSLKKALYHIHFPSNNDNHLVAQKRFAFFDMFLIQLKALQTKKHLKKESAVTIKPAKKSFQKITSSLLESDDDQSIDWKPIVKSIVDNYYIQHNDYIMDVVSTFIDKQVKKFK